MAAALLVTLGATLAIASCAARIRLARHVAQQGRPVAYPWLFLGANPGMWLGLAILAGQINSGAGAAAFLVSLVAAMANLLRYSLRKRRLEHPEIFT